MHNEPVWWMAGLKGRCPRCGEGRIFEGFLKVRDTCEVCGFELGKHDSGDGPAFFVLFLLCIVVTPIALLVNASFDIPLWVNAIVWGGVILGASIGSLRPASGLMIGIQYRSRATGSDWNLPPDSGQE
jgi:uncharacterized protein (DUF983 family)